jgi:hypothetical protein
VEVVVAVNVSVIVEVAVGVPVGIVMVKRAPVVELL